MTGDEKETVNSDKENSTEKGQGSGGASGAMEMGMGMGMAKKMMGQMGKGGPSPMAMMQKMMAQMGPGQGQEGSPQMPPMMQMCMGMCSEMLTAIKRTTDMAAFATPELHRLFAEWLDTVENEALQHLKENGETDAAGLAKALSISEESAAYLIAHMTQSGKTKSHVRAAEESA